MGKYSRKEAKKPITKKWWFWLLVGFVVVGVIGNLLGSADDPQESGTVQEPTTLPTIAVTEPATEATEKEPAPTSALPFNVTFSDTFRNDSTGNWRKALVATSDTIDKYAVDYYKEYFKSDDEVHIIYNFTLNTVNALSVQSGLLSISITEYVEDEEHDAKEACGGEYYGQFQFDLGTGEMTFSSFE